MQQVQPERLLGDTTLRLETPHSRLVAVHLAHLPNEVQLGLKPRLESTIDSTPLGALPAPCLHLLQEQGWCSRWRP